MKNFEVIHSIYSEQKKLYGAFASYVWLGCGIWLFATEPSLNFISWLALAYFAVGTFIAGIVFGILAHLLMRLLAKTMALLTQSPTPAVGVILGTLGLVLMIAQAVLIYYVAHYLLLME